MRIQTARKKNGGICSFAVRSFRDSGYTDARDRLRSDVLWAVKSGSFGHHFFSGEDTIFVPDMSAVSFIGGKQRLRRHDRDFSPLKRLYVMAWPFTGSLILPTPYEHNRNVKCSQKRAFLVCFHRILSFCLFFRPSKSGQTGPEKTCVKQSLATSVSVVQKVVFGPSLKTSRKQPPNSGKKSNCCSKQTFRRLNNLAFHNVERRRLRIMVPSRLKMPTYDREWETHEHQIIEGAKMLHFSFLQGSFWPPSCVIHE